MPPRYATQGYRKRSVTVRTARRRGVRRAPNDPPHAPADHARRPGAATRWALSSAAVRPIRPVIRGVVHDRHRGPPPPPLLRRDRLPARGPAAPAGAPVAGGRVA